MPEDPDDEEDQLEDGEVPEADKTGGLEQKDQSIKDGDDISLAAKSDAAEPIIEEVINSSSIKKPDSDNLVQKPAQEGNDLDDLS